MQHKIKAFIWLVTMYTPNMQEVYRIAHSILSPTGNSRWATLSHSKLLKSDLLYYAKKIKHSNEMVVLGTTWCVLLGGYDECGSPRYKKTTYMNRGCPWKFDTVWIEVFPLWSLNIAHDLVLDGMASPFAVSSPSPSVSCVFTPPFLSFPPF